MKIKISILIDKALNYAVAKAEGCRIERDHQYTEGKFFPGYWQCGPTHWQPLCDYSTDWSRGGPIISEARISRTIDHSGLWVAYIAEGYGEPEDDRKFMQCDRSELVAGLRCYVASKLGDEVEIPEELT